MAEIKSTLEKVLERVASMDLTSRDDMGSQETIKDGMRLGADYLREQGHDLKKALSQHTEKEQPLLRKGVIQTLLRNIVLPKEEDQHNSERAMQGLLDIGKDSRELIQVCKEMKQILDRYLQHKDQMRQQLESMVQQQIEQALAQQGLQRDSSMKIDASRHPKFQEEWQRVKAELSEQYSQALEQHKTFVAQFLSE